MEIHFAFIISIMTSLYLNAQTWTPLSIGVTAQVDKISFPTVDTGYVLLDNSTIRRTTNSGANWSPCTVPVNPAYSIDFVTGQRGCMLQTNGISLTTDGAQTWNNVLTVAGQDFYDVFFLDANVGFASSLNSNLDSLYLYQTTNSGATWTFVSAHGGPYNIFFPELYFISTTIGFTTFDAGILKTTDGGVTWNVVFTDPNTDVWNSMSSPDGVNIFGGGMMGWMYISSNTGSSWTANTQLTYPGYGMYFDSPTHGFYCGGDGLGSGAIEVTTNGGGTWSPAYTGNSFWCMDFPSSSRGYVGGTNGVVVRYDAGPQSTTDNSVSQVSLYPNPATDFITIENVEVGAVITITNSLGQLVKTGIAESNSILIDIRKLAEGIYLCSVVSGVRALSEKVVIQ